MTTTLSHPARWWHKREDDRITCDLCPRNCTLKDGQKGACFVREREGDQMVLTTYGRSSGFCVDPIEKKPFHHYFPGSSVFSFGTAGCNLACRYCQNWDISKAHDFHRLSDSASPTEIAETARLAGCKSVAFTYNDPVIFAEYAMDTADACHERGIETVAVTAGYIHAEPRAEFFSKIDAANVDLKAFTDRFYKKLCAAHLDPVLDTLRYLVHETDVWLELTCLVIPGHNDDNAEITEMADWIATELGTHVPLHFSAFHPDFRMMDVPATPPETLRRARTLAMAAGLKYVYIGNVHDRAGDTTWCPGCGKAVIERDWYDILGYHLDEKGACETCKTPIPGRFGAFTKAFGRHRIPIAIGR